jgi:pilus assembly protein Flp/PilA
LVRIFVRLFLGVIAMARFTQAVVDFVQREDGPTAVEYAVMLALIIVVCLAAITTLGQNANSTFTSVGQKLGSASS